VRSGDLEFVGVAAHVREQDEIERGRSSFSTAG